MDGSDLGARLGAQACAELPPLCEPVSLRAECSAEHGLTRGQALSAGLAGVIVITAALLAPSQAAATLHLSLLTIFGVNGLWRLTCLVVRSRSHACADPPDAALPSYSVIVPLRDEANMIPALVARLDRIDYPRDRLQVILALEVDDAATREAVAEHRLPSSFEVLLVPPWGAPPTKPRACNAALDAARGERIVIYDAEDRPHPGQLREAAARFAAGSASLACLQAPLRIEERRSFLSRQFLLEYAALFEVQLPALAALRLPFPLGGTSNHFRTDVLRRVGGWDAWNVTEDADLGFRLTAEGWRLGTLTLPTYEDPPLNWAEWRPQRTRWLKGYMQTWLVHMRRPARAGIVWLCALQATLGVSLLSALLHGPTALWLAFCLIGPLINGDAPWLPLEDAALLGGAWSASVLSLLAGAARADMKVKAQDLLLAAPYWTLLSIAFCCAAYDLLRRPHHWAKTPHHSPEELALAEDSALDADAPSVVSRAA